MPALEHNWDVNPCNLQPRDLRKLKYRYTVRGRMAFPTDMLRYDRAIVVGITEDTDEWPAHQYTIMGETPPTEGRWNSFMYYVVGEVEKI